MSEVLIWVIFFVFYLVFQVLGNKKRPKRTPLPQPQEGEEMPALESRPRPATLEDALREIQEALRAPQRKPEPPTQMPAPMAQRLPERPAPPKPSPEFHNMEAQFKREMQIGPDEMAVRKRVARKLSPAPVVVQPVTLESKEADAHRKDHIEAHALQVEMLDTLRDPDKLKKAWVVKEILGEPAYKRLRRP